MTPPPALPFSKLCELADFAHDELAPVIRDVCSYKLADFSPEFPRGAEHRKDWEVAMAVRAIRHFGGLRPDALILGVAAGTEDTIFYLARHARQVFATDRYLSTGLWQGVAPITMLLDPAAAASGDFDPDRLVVQHMDGRRLLYPDDTFDAIFSSGSIEHFGEFEDSAAAAYEMGRVLKPGGVLSLSTEFRLTGPPGGIGWPGSTLLFSAEDLQRFIVEASGLELVDEFRPAVSDETLSNPRDIHEVIAKRAARLAADAPMTDATTWDDRPHIVLLREGYVFTSVHLTLRKTDRYPHPDNRWAAPTPAMLEEIAEENRSILERALSTSVTSQPPAPAAPAAAASVVATPVMDLESQRAVLKESFAAAEQGARAAQAAAIALGPRLGDIDANLVDIDRARHATDSAMSEISVLARTAQRRLEELGVPADTPPEDGWKYSAVTLTGGLQFTVVTDPAVTDPVASMLATGKTYDEQLLGLMLDLIRPGDKVLDLGAHVGSFSLAAAAAGAHVLAVEGSPRNVRLLRASVAANDFARLTVVHAAAGDRPGTVQFVDEGPWGRVSTSDDGGSTVPVAAVRIADLLAELRWGPVAFVKMDVEGSEIEAVRGMRSLLEQPDAPAIVYESNGHTLAWNDVTPEQLIGELEDLGYRSYLIDDNRRLVRVDSSHLQPQTFVDYLAVKRLPRDLRGWRVEPVLTLAERIQRLVADMSHPNPHHRAYMARALARAGEELLSHPDVSASRARLAHDEDPEVREAAARWATAGAGSESR